MLMMRLALGVAIFSAFTATAICATDIWEKPSDTWTERDRQRLLTDSPWAGAGSIRYIEMKGAFATPISRTARVLWTSAAPIQQALARQGRGHWAFAREAHRAVPVYTVVMRLSDNTVPGSETGKARARSLSSMQQATFLLREGKPPLGAIEVKGWDDYDDKRDRFAMVLSYAFPALEPIVLADREVTFVTRTCGTGWVPGTVRQDCMYDIRRTFKLKDMLVSGELAL